MPTNHITVKIWTFWQESGYEHYDSVTWIRGGQVTLAPLVHWLPRNGSTVVWEHPEQRHKQRWWIEGINESAPIRRRYW